MKYNSKTHKPALITPAFSADICSAKNNFCVLLVEIKPLGADSGSTIGTTSDIQGKGLQLFFPALALIVPHAAGYHLRS